MKFLILLLDLALAALLFFVVQQELGFAAAYVALFILGALLTPRTSRCSIATFILPRLIQRVMEAYRNKLLPLKYFTFDVSPDKVKFEQEIIAQMPIMPTATSHTPGNDLTLNAQNVKDLALDVPMKIDQAIKVSLKLPVADAVRLELDSQFQTCVDNAGKALAEGIVSAALRQFAASNFTHSFVEAPADFDRDTLSRARRLLTQQKAGAPRFGITNLEAMGTLTADPRIASRDYHAKLVTDDPYVTLENLEGFKAITEFDAFPSDGPVGNFVADAATDTFTLSLHGLPNGVRVRVVNAGGGLPGGLAADTNYFIVGRTADTLQLSATQGGAAINVTSAGTGTHTLNFFENLEAVFFDSRALLIAIRDLNDNVELAKQLGIPVSIKVERFTDPESGLTFIGYMWIDAKHDIYATFVVAFGVRGGRQVSTNAADSLLDRSALRVLAA